MHIASHDVAQYMIKIVERRRVSFEVCFLQAVASTARCRELSLSAAVESSDCSLSRLEACQECALFDATKARISRSALDSFVTEDYPSL